MIFENVQKRLIKIIPKVRDLSNVESGEILGSFSLELRRLQGDLFEVFRFMKGLNR